MQENQMTIERLQELINKRLGRFAGKKYVGLEFHEWYRSEISALLLEHRIFEIVCREWYICAAIKDVIHFDDWVAQINISFEQENRQAAHGTISRIEVSFRAELLSLSLADVRIYLLNQERNKCIADLKRKVSKRNAENKRDAETITFLRRLKF